MTIITVRDFFLWCSIINVVWLTLMFVFILLGRDWIYRIHSRWFALPKEQFEAILYKLLGFYKIGIYLFNIAPCIALYIISR